MLNLGIIIILLVSFLAAHISVYLFLIKFLIITSLAVKNILTFGLIFLGTSFFVATFFAHLKNNQFTRGYYFFAGTWLGLLVNLLVFFILVQGYIFLTTLLQGSTNEKMLAGLAIMAAIIYSGYGIWNAFNPKVTNLTIAIDKLPKQWIGKKIIQLSDVHLGNVYGSNYLLDISQKINKANPDMVLITGDLFDGTDGDLDNFLLPLNQIKAPILYVIGNHEVYLGVEKVSLAIEKTKIRLLADEIVSIDGLQFIGINYPLSGENRDIAKLIPEMSGWNQYAPSILLIHEPVQIAQAKKIGIDLQLSGHTHRGQLFPFGFITSVIFKGYDHGFKRDGSYAIYTSSGLGGWGPPNENRKQIGNRGDCLEIKKQNNYEYLLYYLGR